jgi:hypothetical protein
MQTMHKLLRGDDKARKSIAAWGVTADLLKNLSEFTGRSQIELLHQAVNALAVEVSQDTTDDEEEATHA